MSLEETRYYLNGIYLHAIKDADGEKLRTVSTDGHRLSRVDMNIPKGANDIPGVIVPRKTIMEIRKLLEDHTDTIELSLSDNKIRLSFSNVILTSKLLDGTFPDYSRVIPEQNDKINLFKSVSKKALLPSREELHERNEMPAQEAEQSRTSSTADRSVVFHG